MRKTSGVFSIVLGLGVATYALARLGTVSETTDHLVGVRSAPIVSFLPDMPQPAPTASLSLAANIGKAPVSSASEVTVRPLPEDGIKQKNSRTTSMRPSEASRTPVSQLAAVSGPLDRAALTRELQRQLQRVGCYGGSISGTWTPSTQRAMKDFTDRVNAMLPTAEPDHILLAMLQNHGGQACRHGCPSGQKLVDNGRCLPSAIVLRDSMKKKAPPTQALTAKLPPLASKLHAQDTKPAKSASTEVPTDLGPLAAGRMALAGPKLQAESALLPLDPRRVRQRPDNRSDTARRKTRSTAKYVPSSRRPFGPWIFQEAR